LMNIAVRPKPPPRGWQLRQVSPAWNHKHRRQRLPFADCKTNVTLQEALPASAAEVLVAQKLMCTLKR